MEQRLQDTDIILHKRGRTYIFTLCGDGPFITTAQTRRSSPVRKCMLMSRIIAGLRARVYSVNLCGDKYEVRWEVDPQMQDDADLLVCDKLRLQPTK